ncbi:MAG: hypothetical protein LBJ62_11025 [Bifidobacteriaceae bacterium]|jgi:hypothetical protein|nr:hypothetical protein [Bifidobacteriaceae bacterium]
MATFGSTGGSNDRDAGAYYQVKRSMVIDLDDRLHLRAIGQGGPDSIGDPNTSTATGFWVDGPNVELRNFTQILSSGTAITFSPDSDGSSLKGGETVQTTSNFCDRFAWVMAGAEDISISDYKAGRMGEGTSTSAADYEAIIGIGKAAWHDNNPVKNLRISRVELDNTPQEGHPCRSTDGTGCSAPGVVGWNSVLIDGLTIEDSVFNEFKRPAINFWPSNSPQVTGLDIRGNTFTKIAINTKVLSAQATVNLPFNRTFGAVPSYIRGNNFANWREGQAALNQATAIYWFGAMGNGGGKTASNLYIEDNDFDGYSLQTIHLEGAGTVTVRRNQIGAHSAAGLPSYVAGSADSFEETAAGTLKPALLVNGQLTNQGASGKTLPWIPSLARAASTGPCGLEVYVKPSNDAGGIRPATPLTIDVYWTNKDTAGSYLGSVDGVVSEGWITVPGAVQEDGGSIRVQTQASGDTAQPESTQYSRTLGVNTLGTACSADVKLVLRAWTDVPAEATTHDAIISSGATKLDNGGLVPEGDVWFTYTVENTGQLPLSSVRVTDSFANPVFVITDPIPAGGEAGCARRQGRLSAR